MRPGQENSATRNAKSDAASLTRIAKSDVASSTRMMTTNISASTRIVGQDIFPLTANSGPIVVLIVGEAPGPRGADKSGIPFFGDAAGKHLYSALRNLGAVVLPDSVDNVAWDGLALRKAGLVPVAHGVALSNAFNRCPTDDGVRFRAPKRAELEGAANRARLISEIATLRKRGLRGIVTLGKVAERTLQSVIDTAFGGNIALFPLPHPSAQGLLSMAPNRGRGARMADLQHQWTQLCMQAVRSAGFETNLAMANQVAVSSATDDASTAANDVPVSTTTGNAPIPSSGLTR